jgi:hypothetical protein
MSTDVINLAERRDKSKAISLSERLECPEAVYRTREELLETSRQLRKEFYRARCSKMLLKATVASRSTKAARWFAGSPKNGLRLPQ